MNLLLHGNIIMNKITINIAEDFSPYPWGRTEDVWPQTWELFYKTILKEKYELAIKNSKKLEINLDWLKALPPSFVSESFWALYREFNWEQIFNNIVFIWNNLFLVDFIKETSKKWYQ